MSSITNVLLPTDLCLTSLPSSHLWKNFLCLWLLQLHPSLNISSHVLHLLISIWLVSFLSCTMVKARSSSCFSSRPSVCKPTAPVQLSHLVGHGPKVTQCILLCRVTHLREAPVPCLADGWGVFVWFCWYVFGCALFCLFFLKLHLNLWALYLYGSVVV